MAHTRKPSTHSNVRPITPGVDPLHVDVLTAGYSNEDLEAVNAYKALETRRKRKQRRRIILACIFGALAILGLVWWAVQNIGAAASQEEDPSLSFDYATITTYEKSVSASGAIKPESQAVVTPEVDGIIQEIMVSEGDTVLKGDVLFTLKNENLDKAIEEAEQGLRSAENTLSAAQSSFDGANSALASAQSAYDKVYASLYATQDEADAAGAEATASLNAATESYNTALLAVEDAEIAVTKAQENLNDAQANADKRTVRAPEGGAIVSMGAAVGEPVGGASGAANKSSLITIANLSSLRVSVQVNEVDINNVKEGQQAEVSFSALPDLTLPATVEHIAAISSGSAEEGFSGGIVTYDVDLVIKDPDPRVKPGMTARVKIISEQLEDVLTVPVAALQMQDETQALIMVAPGFSGEGAPRFEERTVTVVAQDGVTAVVEGRIAEGDAVQLFEDSAEDEFFADA